jgi:DNA-binding transcriptional LysR family regulator
MRLREIGAFSGEQLGRLCLGASTTIAQYLLPRLLAQFLRVHSRVDLSVVSANTAQIVDRLLARIIQIGVPWRSGMLLWVIASGATLLCIRARWIG